jgi:phosphoglycolate phosphatase/AHBA synthesis associated protein
VRAVLFDLDGVLVESYDVWFAVMNAAARALGYPPIRAEAFREAWGQGIEADVERFFPRHDVATLERCYEREFPRQLAHLEVAADAPAVLAAARERRLPTAVVTNTPAPLARAVLAHAGLSSDALVGGTDVPRAKPAPDAVLLACARLGAAPRDALLVGDSRFDREAARAAGVRFAGLGIEGDLTLRSLAELLDHLPPA